MTNPDIPEARLSQLIKEIASKFPALNTTSDGDSFQQLREMVLKLLDKTQNAEETLKSNEVLLEKLRGELQNNKLDQEEELDAISELYEEIVSLYEIGRQLGSIIDLGQLLNTIIKMATETLGAQKAVLMLINEQKNVLEIHDQKGFDRVTLPDEIPLDEGLAAQVVNQKYSLILSAGDNINLADIPRFGLEDDTCLITPMLLQDRAIGVLYLGEKDQGETYTAGNEKYLSTLCNQAAIFIDNARMFEESLKQEKFKQQLRIAHDIQTSLLPSTSPQFEGYDVFGTSIPAVEVGGDYFDYLQIGDHQLGVTVGDVSGKGVPAALLMTMTRSIFRSQANLKLSPAQVLTNTNEQLATEEIPDRFVTMIYGLIDSVTNKITISCAGHDPLIIYRAGSRECELHHPSGMVLGIMEDQTYEEMTLDLRRGDIALMYTDGITEAMNTNKEQFGFERIQDILSKHAALSSAELTRKFVEAITDYSQGCPQHDDITLLVIKRI